MNLPSTHFSHTHFPPTHFPPTQVGAAAAGQGYSCRFDALRLEFTTHEAHVLVTRCTTDIATEGSALR